MHGKIWSNPGKTEGYHFKFTPPKSHQAKPYADKHLFVKPYPQSQRWTGLPTNCYNPRQVWQDKTHKSNILCIAIHFFTTNLRKNWTSVGLYPGGQPEKVSSMPDCMSSLTKSMYIINWFSGSMRSNKRYLIDKIPISLSFYYKVSVEVVFKDRIQLDPLSWHQFDEKGNV